MKLRRIKIKNFKAIEDAQFDLSDFNAIVGANGSGKSSVLQALHWMFQSAIHRQVRPRKEGGETLSEREALYMPTPEYRNAGFGAEYGNKVGSPQLDISIEAECDGKNLSAAMWIKSGRNEGIKVRIPAENDLVRRIRDEKREISAYIPGLAGISLQEEKRAKLIVHRQAAAGDANTVLRNILHLLKDKGEKDDLKTVENYVSKVMGDLTLRVEFDDNKHSSIIAEFQTEEMRKIDPKRFKPLELAGIGFLQVIQIFAYLVYFRPVFLLVDEPDAHLHPSTQEKLIQTLAEASETYDTQVILTTHSPSVVRSLSEGSRVIWMREGQAQPNGDSIGREMMGWGLLDKQILLLTEDANTTMLRSILAQWPDLERKVAIWPVGGTGKLLDPTACGSLQRLFGGGMKLILHRDRDFMMPVEAELFMQPYKEKDIEVWLTQGSDIEAYFCEEEVIKAHFDVDEATAKAWLAEAVDASKADMSDEKCRNSKRHALRNQPPLKKHAEKGDIGTFSDQDVVDQYSKLGEQHVVLGKNLVSAIRQSTKAKAGTASSSFGKSLPEEVSGNIADELRAILTKLIA